MHCNPYIDVGAPCGVKNFRIRDLINWDSFAMEKAVAGGFISFGVDS